MLGSNGHHRKERPKERDWGRCEAGSYDAVLRSGATVSYNAFERLSLICRVSKATYLFRSRHAYYCFLGYQNHSCQAVLKYPPMKVKKIKGEKKQANILVIPIEEPLKEDQSPLATGNQLKAKIRGSPTEL